MRRFMQVAGMLAVALAAWLTGCGPTSDPTSDAKGDGNHADLPGDATDTAPHVVVGGADDAGMAFVDWSSGSYPATLIHGPQGGQHIWTSVKTTNLYANKARISAMLYLETPGLPDELVKPGTTPVTGTLKAYPPPPAVPEAGLAYVGLPAFVSQPCKIAQQRVRVQVEVSDLYGVAATGKAWIRPKWTFMPCVVAAGIKSDGKSVDSWPFYPDEGAKPELTALPGGGAQFTTTVRILGLSPKNPKVAVTLLTLPLDNTEGQELAPGRMVLPASTIADPLGVEGWTALSAVTVAVAKPCAAKNQRLRFVLEVLDGEQFLASGQSIVLPSWSGACP